jgi:hypothetical protein
MTVQVGGRPRLATAERSTHAPRRVGGTVSPYPQDFLALKGRLAATQDAGRLFIIPYGQIDYLGFQQAVKETEYEEWFGGLVIPRTATGQEESAEAMPAATAEPETAAETPGIPAVATSPEVPSEGSRTVSPVVKSAVLERFRSRSQTSGIRPRINLPKSTK